MTVGVDDELRIREYPGDDTATPRAYGFKILAADDLRVTRTNADGSETLLVRGTHYTVSGAGNPTGGDVTPLAPIAAGTSWRIEGDMALDQPTDYTAGDDFPAESHERGLDRSMIAHQEARRDINDINARALLVPRGEQAATLPSAAERAGKFGAYDADGKPIAASGTGADAGLRADLAEANGKDLVGGLDTMAEQAADNVDISGGRVSAQLATTSFRRPGFYNLGGDSLPRWSAALAAHRAGELVSTYDGDTLVGNLPARIAILSNSVGRGVGSNGVSAADLLVNAWPSVMTELLGAMPGTSAHANGVFGDGFFGMAGLEAADPRIAFDAGWVIHPTLFSLGGKAFYDPYTNLTSPPLTYDPGVDTDTLDVYFVAFPGYADFIVTVDGDFNGSQGTNGAANLLKATFTRDADFDLPWVILKAGGTADKDLLIAGVEAYMADDRKIAVANMSVSGGKTSHYAADNQNYSFRNALPKYAPHLSIIPLLINDTVANTPEATFKAEAQVIIDAAQRTGDVLLVIDNPIAAGAAPVERQLQFGGFIRDLADANSNGGGVGLPVIDLSERWIAQDLMPNRGLYADGLHPSKVGARDIGQMFAHVVGNPGYFFG